MMDWLMVMDWLSYLTTLRLRFFNLFSVVFPISIFQLKDAYQCLSFTVFDELDNTSVIFNSYRARDLFRPIRVVIYIAVITIL